MDYFWDLPFLLRLNKNNMSKVHIVVRRFSTSTAPSRQSLFWATVTSLVSKPHILTRNLKDRPPFTLKKASLNLLCSIRIVAHNVIRYMILGSSSQMTSDSLAQNSTLWPSKETTIWTPSTNTISQNIQQLDSTRVQMPPLIMSTSRQKMAMIWPRKTLRNSCQSMVWQFLNKRKNNKMNESSFLPRRSKSKKIFRNI